MERVIINGFPKHGNHPLAKGCQLLGVPCQVNHIPFGRMVEGNKHVFIKRDPRNALIAWLRMNGLPQTSGMFITAFRKFQTASLCEEMMEYEGWLTDCDTLVISYEDLIASDATLRRVSDYIGTPYIEGAFEHLPGLTRTWTGPNHSDYRTLWSPEIETVWIAEGGPELLMKWGY